MSDLPPKPAAKSGRKLLVAAVGVATVSYLVACGDPATGPDVSSGNLVAPDTGGVDVTSGNLMPPDTASDTASPDGAADAPSEAADGADGGDATKTDAADAPG